jgi:hypothetical protein
MHLQLAENNEICVTELCDNCGLPPIRPLRSRAKAPDKWAIYDRKKAEWDACREGKGKSTEIHPWLAQKLLPGRAGFLVLLDFNIDGLASRLATENIAAMSSHWAKIGGDPRKLIQFINIGKSKPPRRFNFLTRFKGPNALAEGEVQDDENPAGLTDGQKAAIIGAATAASTAIGAAIPPAAPVIIPAGPIVGAVIVAMYPFIKNAANKSDTAEDAGSRMADIPLPSPTTPTTQTTTPRSTPTQAPWLDQKNFTGFSNKQTVLVGVNAAGVVTAGILYKRKKKKAAAVVLGATLVFDAAFYFINKST